MNTYAFSSDRFGNSFPACSDGSFSEKYYQLLAQLFPKHGVFILLLNPAGELFIDTSPQEYCFKHPDILLHLLTNGSNILFTNNLKQKPYQGVFCEHTELSANFFVCSALKTKCGRLLGAFGVVGQQTRDVFPDEKAFIEWLADNMVQDIQVYTESDSAIDEQLNNFPAAITPFLDDIYIMADHDGFIISMAEQVPAALRDKIVQRGGLLSSVFGEQKAAFFNDMIAFAESTHKKQTNVLFIADRNVELLYSVSCNRFSGGWYLFTFHDITERHRMRELLENRKQLLEGVVQANNVGILLLTDSGDVLYANENATRWFSLNTNAGRLQMPPALWSYTDNALAQQNPFQKVFLQQRDLKDERYECVLSTGARKVFSLNATYQADGQTLHSRATIFIQDVTERALLDQAMQDMEQQMQFLLQASPVVIYQMTLAPLGQITYISPNSAAILGASQDAVLNSKTYWLDHVHPEDRDTLLALLTDKTQHTLEYRFNIEGTDKYRWVKDVRKIVSIENDRSWIGAMLDISDRKRSEQISSQAQRQLELLAEQVPGVLYQYIQRPDGSSYFPYASKGIQQIYGVLPEQVKEDAQPVFNVLHPDDLSRISETIAHSAKTLESWHCRYRVVKADGKINWLEGDATPMAIADGNILWHGYIRDVTEHQMAELKRQEIQHELSSTLDSLIDAVITINPNGQIVELNPATCRMFGYSKDAMLGSNVSMLMPDAVSRYHDNYIKNYLNTGDAKIIGIGREVSGLHADGHEFPIALSIAAVGVGRNLRFVGCCHDLSLIKKQQEQLLHSEKLGAVGKLTSSLAHDFNNILGIVRGYAEMLQQESERVAQLAKPIIEASDRASAMIGQLLDFSSSKKRAVSTVLLNQHLLGLKPLLEKALADGVKLEYQLSLQDTAIGVELPAFDNALINMVVNANHAMRAVSNGCLTISTAYCSGTVLPQELNMTSGDYVSLTISDNGQGMDDETRKKIFEPFFTTKGDAGTGLGLAQTYGMVQRCRGQIQVVSVLGKGSSFTLYLPILPRGHKPAENNHDVGLNNSEIPAGLFSPHKQEPAVSDSKAVILLVDDETELLEMNTMLLESAGFGVLAATSAKQAISLAGEHAFDLLLSDIVMPEMNGFELAKIIKTNYPAVKVQLMSGFADKSMISDEQYNTWYEQRLAKPVALSALLKRISEVLAE